MTIRRHCDPMNVRRIWDAIRSVNQQGADLTKILKYLQKEDEQCTMAEVELYVQQCLDDGLILRLDSTNYTVTPQEWPTFDDKDWYCFECHLAGEVNCCANCFRVFHSECIKTTRKKFDTYKSNSTQTLSEDPANSYNFDDNLCYICNLINIDENQLEKGQLNYLLKFVLNRVRMLMPNTITHTMAVEDRPSWLTDSELTWRANQLFFEHRDMSVIEVNLKIDCYGILAEFLADIMTIQHNVAIFHGIKSQEYAAADQMVRDTLYDVTELRNCQDCYRNSNEKLNTQWFAIPCQTPHELVWAKQKGYPYWPAKVIKASDTQVDVRFFGGKHERALISKTQIKPISVPKESLKIKASTAFTRSLEELICHQKLLANPQEVEKMLQETKTKRQSRKSYTTVTLPTVSLPSSSNPPNIVIESPLINNEPTKRSSVDLSAGSMKKQKGDDGSSNVIVTGNVIQISDCEEEETDYSFRANSSQLTNQTIKSDASHEVSSSTESFKNATNDNGLHQLDQPYSDAVEKMRRTLEAMTNKNEIVRCAMDCMQAEIDRSTEEHNEHLKRLFESHNAQISETKKKQWCYNCEQDAIYHCCWNTAYCSQTCQQQHWQAEHKKVCRRKRQI